MVSTALRPRLVGFILLFIIAALDQWSKSLMLQQAASFALPREITAFFTLVLVHNRGISFGFLGQAYSWMPDGAYPVYVAGGDGTCHLARCARGTGLQSLSRWGSSLAALSEISSIACATAAVTDFP